MLSTLLSKAVQKAQELPEAIQDELAEQFIRPPAKIGTDYVK